MARLLVVLAALVCAACALSPPRQHALFDTAPCAFEVPARASVRCGWLTVPENRANPNTRDIRLHVAIYRSTSDTPRPDPIVWLVGGPGGRANFLASKLYDRVVAPYLWNRDFIVMDVRGTGYSRPALDCPERDDPPRAWVRPCRDRLARTADLSAYHSAAVAQDLAALRDALGIAEWNVFGESYGTRLALTAARDAPQGIRTLVLDSVVPPDADEYGEAPAKLDAAVDALCRGCASDASCNAAFPNVRGTLLAAADALDRAPRRIQGEYFGRPYDVTLDGRAMIQALHMALYESDLIPRLPKAIHGRDDGAWGQALAVAASISRSVLDIGAHLSYHCAEEVPFTDWAKARAGNARLSWQRGVAFAPHMADECRYWRPGEADPREALPVESAIPSLVLSGELDPVTPPRYGASAASHLSKSVHVVFPGMGHWVSANPVNDCAQSIARAFLDDPSTRPRAHCAAAYKPKWALP